MKSYGSLSVILRMVLAVSVVLMVGACSEDDSSGNKQMCKPNERVCEDGVPQECNASGTAWTALAPCEGDDTCFEGYCEAPADTDTVEGDTTEDQCSEDEDCAGQVTLGVCQRAICDAGECGVIVSVDGTECNDGVCVVGVCKTVVCEPNALICGETISLDEGTVYQCDAWGTGAAATGTICDDGDTCNGLEACLDGQCIPGEVAPCSDGNPCTNDVCDPIRGCTFVPNTDACEDGDDCTTDDVCADGECTAGNLVVCDDSDPCVTNVCVDGQGCVATPGAPGMPCDDGDACTTGETCEEIGCTGGSPIDCADPGPCKVVSCDPISGCLAPTNAVDGSLCDDGLACTNADACAAGVCLGTAVVCGEATECALVACVEDEGGCVTQPIEGLCDDGDPCTTGESCIDGLCAGGTVVLSESCGTPKDAACALSGAAGTKVVCLLHLARGSMESAVPSAYQFTLTWDAEAAGAMTFQDEFCTPAGCLDVPVPPATLQPSGHQIQTFPTPVSAWAGVGNVIVTNIGNPLSALSEAYLDAEGTLVGDSVWVDLVFEMKKTVDPATPVYVTYSKMVAATPDAMAMDVATEWGLVITTK